MCTKDRPQHIVCRSHIGGPISHGLTDGILEGAAAGIDAGHRRAEQPHAENVQCLPLHILRTHVDLTLQSEHGSRRGGRHSVLPGARSRQ